jgi:hypothetical protein
MLNLIDRRVGLIWKNSAAKTFISTILFNLPPCHDYPHRSTGILDQLAADVYRQA